LREQILVCDELILRGG